MTNYSLILFLNNPNKPKPASNIIKAGFWISFVLPVSGNLSCTSLLLSFLEVVVILSSLSFLVIFVSFSSLPLFGITGFLLSIFLRSFVSFSSLSFCGVFVSSSFSFLLICVFVTEVFAWFCSFHSLHLYFDWLFQQLYLYYYLVDYFQL